jgi:hypothetical protein
VGFSFLETSYVRHSVDTQLGQCQVSKTYSTFSHLELCSETFTFDFIITCLPQEVHMAYFTEFQLASLQKKKKSL